MQIAAALRTWILESAQNGCTFEGMLAAMEQSGHKAGYARDVLRHVLGEKWQPVAEASAPAVERLEVPEPAPDSGRYLIDTQDRAVAVIASLRIPRIIVFEGLLAPEECEALCELAVPRMHRARTINRETGSSDEHTQRISDGSTPPW